MRIRRSYLGIFMLAGTMAVVVIVLKKPNTAPIGRGITASEAFEWKVPDTSTIPATKEGELIRYGRNLISNTAFYLGPKGKIAALTNGMNCQNCHLAAGTKFLGNNYGAVQSTYPKFRARSGTIETIDKRINDCVERSLNGTSLDSNSRELKAIHAYISWLGENVPVKVKPKGSGIADIPFLQRAANPDNGRSVYLSKCQSCHGTNGQGLSNHDGNGYVYPPLWGNNSYNTGAGLYRISRFAGYVKVNMPFGAFYNNTILSDDEAWDVAAFVNSQPRPHKRFALDWPDIAAKPFDHPEGPYSDGFSERQHKYGPFSNMNRAK